MHSHHILTVGISLFTNACRQIEGLTKANAEGKHREIEALLSQDPCKATAEINSLNRKTGFMDQAQTDLEVTLAYTTTQMGKLCSSLLQKELKRRGVVVHDLPVKGVDAPTKDYDPSFAQEECRQSLQDLRQRVNAHIAKLLEKEPAPEIELNCTGGFKAECAVLYELGNTLRLPVYYLHEDFKVCVEIP